MAFNINAAPSRNCSTNNMMKEGANTFTSVKSAGSSEQHRKSVYGHVSQINGHLGVAVCGEQTLPQQ